MRSQTNAYLTWAEQAIISGERSRVDVRRELYFDSRLASAPAWQREQALEASAAVRGRDNDPEYQRFARAMGI